MERVKERGGEGKDGSKFPSFTSPTPVFLGFFWFSPHFPRRQNTENPVPRSLFASKPHGNVCYVGYLRLGMRSREDEVKRT